MEGGGRRWRAVEASLTCSMPKSMPEGSLKSSASLPAAHAGVERAVYGEEREGQSARARAVRKPDGQRKARRSKARGWS